MLTDFHAHVVYGVDDGAVSEEESHEMLRQAWAQGVGRIVCTSHVTPGHHAPDRTAYSEHLDALRAWAQTELPGMRLCSGCELFYTGETMRHLVDGQMLTIGDTRNVLVEFLPEMDYEVLKRAALDMQQAGFTPILAHVERYGCLRPSVDKLAQLKAETGALAQMNANTVLKGAGLFGDKWVRQALRGELIDVVASDAHHATGGRVCRLGEAQKALARICADVTARQLCDEIPAMLAGE